MLKLCIKKLSYSQQSMVLLRLNLDLKTLQIVFLKIINNKATINNNVKIKKER